MFRYAVTIFISAFLLFLVQPLIAKYILPWFGGGSGVWTACLLFFQTVLLAGYAYAHVLTKLRPRAQGFIHLALLATALMLLPIVPAESWKPSPDDNPTVRIVLLLAACLGAPFLMLSSTGPLLQAWFTRTHPGQSPYRLYALSNTGSLLALLGYPFVVEPALTRYAQAIGWSIGFAAFAALCGWCAIGQTSKRRDVATPAARVESRKAKGERRELTAESREPTAFVRIMWIALPMCASIMLLSATSQVGDEVAPIPFLWVLTLAVYLISFIVTFEWPALYDRRVWGLGLLAAPWVYFFMMVTPNAGLRELLAGHIAVLLCVCMVCHGELYRLRPAPQRLTSYYLGISAGGALGGAFVTLVAPQAFTFNAEYFLGMFGALALWIACLFVDRDSPFYRGAMRPAWLGLIMVVALSGVLTRLTASSLDEYIVLRLRNFYGNLSLRILTDEEDPGTQYMRLEHGRITHGSQLRSDDPAKRRQPTLYYGPTTGVGLVMGFHPSLGHRRVGVVGLGTGTMATWGDKGDVYRFYEINPQVLQLARDHFTYLAESDASIDVVMGDARSSLENEEPQRFDVLVLDAFSGDAIPVHLLTLEAFRLYDRHMAQGGVIAVNVTNRYMDLHPIVHRIAEELGYATAFVMTPEDNKHLVGESHWVLLTRDENFLNHPLLAQIVVRPPGRPRVSLWTDEYASVLEVLR